jgi:superfamily II DNA or RNA helicase
MSRQPELHAAGTAGVVPPAPEAVRTESADSVRRQIACAWLGAPATATRRIGRIVLHPHQSEAVARLRRPLSELGGALLADDVGLGKTYVALALAGEAARPLVVAPAALRPMWLRAMAEAGVHAPFVSVEQLSRARPFRDPPPGASAPDLVVVDEAQHLRNPATRRYARLTTLASAARVLLISATPIHNRSRDLTALLALFLGARAHALDPGTLGRLVVRRTSDDVDPRSVHPPIAHGSSPAPLPPPAVARTIWLRLPPDPHVLAALVSLPSPLPPADGDHRATLVTWALVRAWASSDGALRTMLRRRLARAAALAASLDAGRHPTRAELRSWTFADQAVQLGFPELLAAPAAGDAPALLRTVRSHEAGLRRTLALLADRPDRDRQRAALLQRIRADHVGARVVVFSQFAATVDAVYRQLATSPRVAMLTARGAATAGGRLSRRDVLDRFAPLASGVPPPRAVERVDLLLATDLLSEGVNLQDASVVVHLDLPWTPARLAQRVGRVARLGSQHGRVHVYGLAPPADAERWLRTVERLQAKTRIARTIVGVHAQPDVPAATDDVVPASEPPGAPPPFDGAAPEHAQALARTLAGWCGRRMPRMPRARDELSTAPPISPAGPAVISIAAVRAPIDGFLALLGGPAPMLLASLGDGPSPALPVVVRCAALAQGAAASVDPAALRVALAALREWTADADGRLAAGLDVVPVGRPASGEPRGDPVGRPRPAHGRHRVAARVAHIVRTAPPHRRPLLSTLAAQARAVLALPSSAALERALAALGASADRADERWLAAVVELSTLTRPASPASSSTSPRPIALLLLQRGRDA